MKLQFNAGLEIFGQIANKFLFVCQLKVKLIPIYLKMDQVKRVPVKFEGINHIKLDLINLFRQSIVQINSK